MTSYASQPLSPSPTAPSSQSPVRRRLRQYLDIYGRFLALNIERALAFRVHFALLVLMDICFYLSLLLTIDFTFRLVGPIDGWTREHFMFFAAFMLAVDQLHMTFISESFWNFSAEIRTGALDFTLLRPANPIFITFFRFIRAGSLVIAPVPWVIMIHYGIILDLSVLAWLVLPLMVLLTLALISALEILLMLSGFWLVDSIGMNFLRMQLQDVSRWPDIIYHPLMRRLFTFFVPILLASSAPVRFLFDQTAWEGVAGALFALAAIILMIAALWRRGLRRYESASS